MVAVRGFAPRRRPQHSFRRALLTHRAPASGFGVEAVTGQPMPCLDWRKLAIDEADQALPGGTDLLTASPKRREPEPAHRIAEPPHARVVTRDGVVV
jgi:hypothetical protein